MGVHGDEINLGFEPVDKPYELFGVGDRVVNAGNKNVLESDAVPGLHRVCEQSLFECSKVPGFVDGHQTGSQFVIGRVQADGKAHRHALTKGRDLGNEARCRHGDPVPRETEGLRIDHDLAGADDCLEVIKGFAHAHEDDVGDARATMVVFGSARLEALLGQKDLGKDLASA